MLRKANSKESTGFGDKYKDIKRDEWFKTLLCPKNITGISPELISLFLIMSFSFFMKLGLFKTKPTCFIRDSMGEKAVCFHIRGKCPTGLTQRGFVSILYFRSDLKTFQGQFSPCLLTLGPCSFKILMLCGSHPMLIENTEKLTYLLGP